MISSLADAIIALINSKPRSPTKAEIEETLEGLLGSEEVVVKVVSLPCPGEWRHVELRAGETIQDALQRQGFSADYFRGCGSSGLADDGSAVFEEPHYLRCPATIDGKHALMRVGEGLITHRCACGYALCA